MCHHKGGFCRGAAGSLPQCEGGAAQGCGEILAGVGTQGKWVGGTLGSSESPAVAEDGAGRREKEVGAAAWPSSPPGEWEILHL